MNLDPKEIASIVFCVIMLLVIIYVISVSDNSNQPPYAF